jgi:hypothetical protein
LATDRQTSTCRLLVISCSRDPIRDDPPFIFRPSTMASSSTAAASSALVVRRLYRSLLRTAKPFTAPSENAVVLTCLLHRTGIDDNLSDWDGVVTALPKYSSKTQDQARDLTLSYNQSPTGTHVGSQRQSYPRLFRKLLREVIAGPDGVQKMLFPRQVDPSRLRDVVRREFRDDDEENVSSLFDISTRRKVAFVALRELNKKLSYFDVLQDNSPKPLRHQAAWHVSQLPFQQPSAYLKPGTFLVSNPHMNDSFFARTVICILEHNDDDAPKNAGNTYGLIVNRVSVNSGTGKNRTLREAFKENHLPKRLADVFGDAVVKEGGPVHSSIQMLYSAMADNDELTSIGGSVIPTLPEGDNSPALYSDRATYFQGDIFKAMDAVDKGIIERGKCWNGIWSSISSVIQLLLDPITHSVFD